MRVLWLTGMVCWLVAVSGAFVPPAMAADKRVVATLPLLHSIVSDLSDGVDGLSVESPLLTGQSSPHHFNLKPSQARRLRDADLLIWIGPSMETALVPSLKRFVAPNKWLTIQDIKTLDLLDYHGEHSHDDDHHSEETVDPHFWLDPVRMKRVVSAVAGRLSALVDDNGKVVLDRNLGKLVKEMDRLTQHMRNELAGFKLLWLVSAHDAMRYVGDMLDLKRLDVLVAEHDHKPKLSSVLSLRKRLKASKLDCVINERGASAWSKRALGKAPVRVVEIDPLGVHLKSGARFYSRIVEALVAELKSCAPKTG